MIEPYYQKDGITLYCGDCLDILPTFADKSIDLILTDPPYGIGRKYDNYDDSPGKYWQWFLPALEIMKNKSKVLAFSHRSILTCKMIKDFDWVIAWYKPYSAGARIGNSPIVPHWEPIYLYGMYSLGTKRDALPDVLKCNPEKSPTKRKSDSPRDKAKADNVEGKHPLPKPINLMEQLICGLSLKQDLVLDPFCGSGTTLVAAKRLGRKAIGIEISEKYCKIAVDRLRQKELF